MTAATDKLKTLGTKYYKPMFGVTMVKGLR